MRRYLATPEGRVSHREYMRRYLTTPEGREAQRRWAQENPEKKLAHKAARRAREVAAGTPQTPSERAAVRDVYRKACLAEGFTGTRMAVDHRQPVVLGGSSLAENLQHLPAAINASKHARTHEEALVSVPGYREWCEGPPTFEQRALSVRLGGRTRLYHVDCSL
jgi:hypothetical protein